MIYSKNKTFTGTDTLVFIVFPKTKPILLGSLTTLSYSLYRHKTHVPLLGRITTGGCTRGTRVVAGTMIFTLINQHWVNELKDNVKCLEDYDHVKADELPICDLMIISANESGSSVAGFIYGLDFTEEAGVISVEDLMIENTFKFVARDIDLFYENDSNNIEGQKSKKINSISTYYDNNYDNNYDDGNDEVVDVRKVQSGLVREGYLKTVTGSYDNETINAVKDFQRDHGLLPTGYMNMLSRNILLNESKSKKINKKREKIYIRNNNNEIVDFIEYGDFIEIYEEDNEKIEVSNGYIKKDEVYEDKNLILISNFNETYGYIDFTKLAQGCFKITVDSEEDVNVDITCISYFEDNNFEVTKYKTLASNKKLVTSNIFAEAVIYNEKHNAIPKKLEVIVKIKDKYNKYLFDNIKDRN